jgi:hypothetical protein
MKNVLITCTMKSAFCGDAPMLDGLVEFQQAAEEGTKNNGLISNNMKLSEIERPKSLFEISNIFGYEVAHVSSPILSDVLFSDYVTHAGQVVSEELLSCINKKAEKKLPTTKGRYKSYYQKYNVRYVNSISWFARCEIEKVVQILQKIQTLGKKRACGYGQLKSWSYKRVDKDLSFFVDGNNGLVLMRPLPIDYVNDLVDPESYYHGEIGVHPPYWHPETSILCAIPV